MRGHVRRTVGILCLFMSLTTVSAQGKSDPRAEAILTHARELSNLHQPDTPSFRLQASFETYDYKGEPDGKGILSEAYIQGGPWQRSILYRDKHSRQTSAGGTVRTVSDVDYQTTFALERIIEKLFAPLPPAERMSKYFYSMTTMKAGSISLSCVVASLPDKSYLHGVVSNEAYCVDKDPAIIRVVEGHNGLRFTFNRILRLGAVYVPGEITMAEKGKLRAHIKVDGIVPLPELKADDLVLPPADSGGAQEVASSVLAGRIKTKANLVYPEDAIRRHIQARLFCVPLSVRTGRYAIWS
jgi:hypothetical protein